MKQIARLTKLSIFFALPVILILGVLVFPKVVSAVTVTYNYQNNLQQFTVPANVTSLSISMRGGAGGIGGTDGYSGGVAGYFVGQVSGTISVTPGQVLSIYVGSGGGAGSGCVTNTGGGTAGTNALGSYNGGRGGNAGTTGCSGGGGGGGAASVVVLPNGNHIVAGGGGGSGGGNNIRRDAVQDSTQGTIVSGRNGTAGTGPVGDGGGGGGGGGGFDGGAGGQALKINNSNEFFGYGGNRGTNAVGGLGTLSASTATQTPSSNGQVTFTYKINQSISFGALQNKTLGTGTVSLAGAASASSGLSVTYSSATTPVCTVSATTITLVSAGTCTINADQGGNADYNAAARVQQSFNVSSAISISTPSSGLTGTFNSSYSLSISSAGGANPKTFTVSSGTLPGGLTLDASTGVISGNPTAAGSSSVAIRVTDANGAVANTSSFTITISSATLANASAPTLTATAGVLNSISANWSAVTNASSYTLKIYAVGGATPLRTITGFSDTSTTITSGGGLTLEDNTTYQVSVTAVGTGNYATSSESSKTSVTTNQSFTITYNYNGGSGDASATYITGASALTLPVPTRDGFSFDGWYEDSNFSTAALTSPYTPTQSRTLYAKWTGDALNPTFGTPTPTADGFTVQITNYNPSFTWVGYATEDGLVSISGTGLVTVTGVAPATDSALTINTSRSGYLDGSATVIATSLAAYVVTYDSKGGSLVSDGSFTAGGSITSAPTAPNLSGFSFIGWSATEDGSVISFPYSPGVTNDITLYAVWASTLAITTPTSGLAATVGTPYSLDLSALVSGGPGGNSYSVSRLPAGLSLDLSRGIISGTPTTAGSTSLTASVLDSSGTTKTTSSFTIQVQSADLSIADKPTAAASLGELKSIEVTWTAVANAATYNLKIYSADGSDLLITLFGLTGTSKTILASDFADILDDATYQISIKAIGDSNWNSSAESEKVIVKTNARFTVTYSYNGGSGIASDSYIEGAINLILPSPTREGYSFDGWSETSSFDILLGTTYTPTSSLTLYAKWTADTYSVTFAKGTLGTGGDQSLTKTHDISLSLPDSDTANSWFTRTGYTLIGWSVNENGTTTDYLVGDSFTGNSATTFYPVWAANTYLVTFEYNNATGGNEYDSASYTVDSFAINLPNPIRTGYSFAGWYEAADFSGTALGESYEPTQNQAIYAKWSPNQITVTLYKNDGSLLSDIQEITADVSTAIKSNPFTRTGYTFTGWSENSDGSGTQYSAGENITVLVATNLYAKWSANTLTATFNQNYGSDGTVTQSITADSETKLRANTFSREGYIFSGWSANSDGSGSTFGDEETVTILEDKTYYAIWTVIDYIISYNLNEATGTTPTESIKNIGDTFIVADNSGFSRTGYSFGGWSDGTNTYQAGDSYTVGSENVTLIAIWNVDSYVVTYDPNGAEGSAERSSDTHVYGSPAIALPGKGDLTRIGYTFGGWAITESGSAIGATYTPTKDVTLYAVWNPNTYTIIYDTNGASGAPSINSETYTSGDLGLALATIGSMTKTGNDFMGWSTTVDGSIVSTPFTTTKDLTLYAIWQKIPYSISYDLAGGNSAVPSTVTKFYSDTIVLPGTPTRAANLEPAYEWTFVAWSDGVSQYQAEASYVVGTSDVEFTAIWTKSFTVIYSMNGATSETPASVIASDGVEVTLAPTPIKPGHVFAGWQDQSGTLYAAGATLQVSETAFLLYAQWTAIDYFVSYALNGGTSTQPTGLTVNIGNEITVTGAPTRAGYTFNGWSYEDQLYAPSSKIIVGTSDITFTADWTPIIYIVTYDMGGSTDTKPEESNKIIGDQFTLAAAPTRLGYNFTGWFDGTSTRNAGATYTVGEGNILLEATWQAVNYTLTYNVNGGNSSTPTGSTTLNIGNTFSVAPAPTHENRTFLGWSDGTSNYLPGQTYTVLSSNITLTAVWSEINYTITYDLNGGSGTVPTETTRNSGQTFTVKSDSEFIRTNYTFAGWKINGIPVSVGEVITVAESNLTLIAQWTPAFVVSFDSDRGSEVSSLTYTGTALTKPTNPTRANFVFEGWLNGSELMSWPFAPVGPVNLKAKWTQLSLYGLDPDDLLRFGSIIANNAVSATFSGSNDISSVTVRVPAGALPNGTVVNIDLVQNMSRAQSVISSENSYLVSFVLSWLGLDGTVPNTATGKPIVMTISNAEIKTGAIIYSVLGGEYTVLGRATQDGTVTIEITEDPEILVAATKPEAPVSVTASSPSPNSLRVSWLPPAMTGGSDITGYTVTTNSGQVCVTNLLTCTITGLRADTAYSLTVVASNLVGDSSASIPSGLFRTAQNPPPASSGSSSSANNTTDGGFIPKSQVPKNDKNNNSNQSSPTIPSITQNPLAVNPQASPNSSVNSTSDAPSINRSGELIRKSIQEISPNLSPIVINLNLQSLNNDPTATATSTAAIKPLSIDTALALADGPENAKRVSDAPASVLVNGQAQESRIIILEETKAKIITIDGTSLIVESKTAQNSIPVDSSGRIQMVKGNFVEAIGQGLAPNSEFAVYLFSDPLLLGVGKADEAGNYFISYFVDFELPTGDHTFQIVGVDLNNEQKMISLPVAVLETKKMAEARALTSVLLGDDAVKGSNNTYERSLVLIILLIIASLGIAFFNWRKQKTRA